MEINSLGTLVAIRTLDLLAEDGTIVGTVSVKLGKPKKIAQSEDYYCPFQILGIGSEKIRYGIGVDAMQALILALTKIGSHLYTSSESKSRRLRWMGDQSGNLGVLLFTESALELVLEPTHKLLL